MNTKHGFTLLEILVSIALVLILAAVLIPVFSGARESTNAQRCVSQLRQAGVAMQSYITDMGNRIVTRTDGERGGEADIWGAELSGRGYLTEPARTQGYRSETGQDGKLLRCPMGDVPENITLTNWAWFTYSLNLFTPGAKNSPQGKASISIRSVASIPNPAAFPLLADGATGPGNLQDFRLRSNKAGLALRHRGKANVLFLDGHIEALTQQEGVALGFPQIYFIEKK